MPLTQARLVRAAVVVRSRVVELVSWFPRLALEH